MADKHIPEEVCRRAADIRNNLAKVSGSEKSVSDKISDKLGDAWQSVKDYGHELGESFEEGALAASGIGSDEVSKSEDTEYPPILFID